MTQSDITWKLKDICKSGCPVFTLWYILLNFNLYIIATSGYHHVISSSYRGYVIVKNAEEMKGSMCLFSLFIWLCVCVMQLVPWVSVFSKINVFHQCCIGSHSLISLMWLRQSLRVAQNEKIQDVILWDIFKVSYWNILSTVILNFLGWVLFCVTNV